MKHILPVQRFEKIEYVDFHVPELYDKKDVDRNIDIVHNFMDMKKNKLYFSSDDYEEMKFIYADFYKKSEYYIKYADYYYIKNNLIPFLYQELDKIGAFYKGNR
jgi:hypothetical protein